MHPRVIELCRSLPRTVLAFVLLYILFAAMPFTAFGQEVPVTTGEPATATVLVRALNVRSGPGTSYARIGSVGAGDILAIHGKNVNCGWLQVTTTADLDGWVSADPRYVAFDVACDDLLLATPVQVATAVPAAAGAPATTETAAVAPTPVAPTATPEPAPADADAGANTGIPDGKGCIAFGNYVGPDLIISGAHWDTHEPFDIKVLNSTVGTVCIAPGRWGITISAISNRWRDFVLDMDVKAGEVIDFPLVPVP